MKKIKYEKIFWIILVLLFIPPFADPLSAEEPIEETFGYEIAGGSGEWIGYSDPEKIGWVLRGTSYTAPSSGALTAIYAYIQMPYGEGHGYDLELGIYEEDFYGPNSHKLIANEKEKNLYTSGWKNVYNFGEPIIAGKNYILVALAFPHYSTVHTFQIDLAYDTVGTNRYYEIGGLLWYWQDPWNKAPTGIGRNYSIYCTYIPIIPPPPPTIIRILGDVHIRSGHIGGG